LIHGFKEIILKGDIEMRRSVTTVGVLLLLGMFSGGVYAAETTVTPETPAASTVAPAGTTPAAEKPKVEEPKVTGNAGLGVFNRYIFRGYELGQRSAVIQPTSTVSYRGFSATFWGNLDTRQHATQNFSPSDRQRTWNETDLTLSYTYNVGKLGLTAGYIYYGANYAKQTQEIFGSATYDIIGHPTIAINQDIAAYEGTYLNLSFSQSQPIVKLPTGDLTVDLGLSFGYMIGEGKYWKTYQNSTGDYTGTKYNALHDGMGKLGFTAPLGKGFTVQPVVQYWFPLSGKAHHNLIDGNSYQRNGAIDNTFVYGINFGFAF
jgi:hypothetical protein